VIRCCRPWLRSRSVLLARHTPLLHPSLPSPSRRRASDCDLQRTFVSSAGIRSRLYSRNGKLSQGLAVTPRVSSCANLTYRPAMRAGERQHGVIAPCSSRMERARLSLCDHPSALRALDVARMLYLLHLPSGRGVHGRFQWSRIPGWYSSFDSSRPWGTHDKLTHSRPYRRGQWFLHRAFRGTGEGGNRPSNRRVWMERKVPIRWHERLIRQLCETWVGSTRFNIEAFFLVAAHPVAPVLQS